MEEGVNVPAGHQSVLSRYGDHSGLFVLVLTVGDEPGDGFAVIASNALDHHHVFRVQVAAVQYLEGPIVEGHADLAFGVRAHLNQRACTLRMFFCSISFSLICLMASVR
jgi:hypothetical protein